MDAVVLGVRSVGSGFREALALRRPLDAVRGSATIRRCLLKCFFLNGLLFLGSIVLFERVLTPLLATSTRTLFGADAGDVSQRLGAQTRNALTAALTLLYYVRRMRAAARRRRRPRTSPTDRRCSGSFRSTC